MQSFQNSSLETINKMAAPMQEVVVDDKANAFTSDNKTKPNLTQSKELLNIHGT